MFLIEIGLQVQNLSTILGSTVKIMVMVVGGVNNQDSGTFDFETVATIGDIIKFHRWLLISHITLEDSRKIIT